MSEDQKPQLSPVYSYPPTGLLPVDLTRHLALVEQWLLEAAMILSDGKKRKAAELLMIDERSLRYRLHKYFGDRHFTGKFGE